MQRLRTVSVVLGFKFYKGDFYIGQELFDFNVKLEQYNNMLQSSYHQQETDTFHDR